VRGRDWFNRIVRNVREFVELKQALGRESALSLWLTGLRETLEQLPDFIRLAADIGVPEVHLQRLVHFPEGQGLARPESSLFERLQQEMRLSRGGASRGRGTRGVLRCLGCRGAGGQFEARRHGATLVDLSPPLDADVFHGAWPRDSLLHRALFDARLPEFYARRRHPRVAARHLERRGYQAFRQALLSDAPPSACAGCGLRWSL
jgi:MoaA/NifB/PqqE/SkfB family radical SAM enzyme